MADSKLLPLKVQNGFEKYLAAVSIVLRQHWDPKVHALLLERLHRDVWYRFLEKRLPYFESSPAVVLIDFARNTLLSIGGDLLKYHHGGSAFMENTPKVPAIEIDAEASATSKTSISEG